MSHNPPINEQQWQTLLLLEATGIIHDLGKFHDLFIKSQAKESNHQFAYWAIVDPTRVYPVNGESLTENTAPYHDLTDEQQDRLLNTKFTYQGQDYSIAYLLLGYNGSSLYTDHSIVLNKLLHSVHGNSHYEKEDPPGDPKQPYDKTYRSSPFGMEVLIETGTNPELTNKLRELPLAYIHQIDTAPEERTTWLKKMRDTLSDGIADNRRPINEVNLWDWGWTVGSFVKAAVAGEFYTDQELSLSNLDDLAWRVLRVNIDVLSLLARPSQLSDVIALRDETARSLQEVRDLLEYTWAIGNQLYDDATGAYFIFPNMELSTELEEEVYRCFDEDLKPQVCLEEESVCSKKLNPRSGESRQEVKKLITNPLNNARGTLKKPVLNHHVLTRIKDQWRDVRTEICTACQTRPQGYLDDRVTESWARNKKKARDRNLCCICLHRRGRRAKEWADNIHRPKPSNNIWLGEIADNNGRFGLIVGHLGIDAWMDGEFFKTLSLQAAQQNFKSKIPSPARLTRMRRTCAEFWESCEQNEILNTVGTASRWAILPQMEEIPSLQKQLGDYHAYEIPLPQGTSLSVVWDAEQKRLLTNINLEYLAGQLPVLKEYDTPMTRLRHYLYERHTIRESSEYLKPSRQIDVNFTVNELITNLPEYNPYIRLLIRPDVFLAIVPADKALTVIRKMYERYVQEFGLVRDRLPIHLGVIFAPQRTPMRSVLDASQSMLKEFGRLRWEEWELEQSDLYQANNSISQGTLQFTNGIKWEMPNNDFYTYYYCKERPGRSSQIKHLTGLRPQPTNEQGNRIVGRGMRVGVRPSTFDFEFLDTTGRRFEIHYNGNGQRTTRPTRPWLLDDLSRLEKLWEQFRSLETSQIYQIIGAIEETANRWKIDRSDPVFRQFVSDTLAGAAWPKEEPWKKYEHQTEMIEAGCAGLLTDLTELHLQILKEEKEQTNG